MRRLIVASLLSCAVLSTGCSSLSRLADPFGQAASAVFTETKLEDLQLVGVKSGPLLPVQAGTFPFAVGEESQELAGHFAELSLGVILPITRVGETTPWWIYCPAGEMQRRCEEVPANARVTFTGRPLDHGVVLLPTRLTWSER
jgi:hypothetical protein